MAQLIKRGDAWSVRVFRGRDANGKRKFVSKTIRGPKRAALEWARKVELELSTDTYREPTKQTVADFLKAWLDGTAAQRVRAKTLSSYRQLVANYIVPQLGDRALRQLTLPEIDRSYAALSDRGLSPRTVRYVHSVLRQALGHAVKSRLLVHNPSDYATLPRQQRTEMRALTADEGRRFLEAAADDRWYALWALLLTAGLRPSEALGLRWSDVEPGRIRVQRTLVHLGGGDWRFDECKTSRSRRTVPIPPVADAALRTHRARQAEEKLAAGPAYNDHGLVFASPNGNPPDPRSLVRNHFDRVLAAASKKEREQLDRACESGDAAAIRQAEVALKKVELPKIRLYDLRHTSASLLLAEGVHPKVVSERLGHSTVMLTLDVYSHVIPALHEESAQAMERLLSARASSTHDP
jgi:integrase